MWDFDPAKFHPALLGNAVDTLKFNKCIYDSVTFFHKASQGDLIPLVSHSSGKQ